MSRSVLTCLLWGLALGFLETAFFTRANHLYPVGLGHVWISLAVGLAYGLVAFVASVAAARWRRGREAARGVLPALIGPWFLLVIVALSHYRERIDTRADNIQRDLATLAIILVLVILLWVATRALTGRARGTRRALTVLGALLVVFGAVRLATSREAPPLPSAEQTVSVAEVGGPRDTGLRVLIVGLDGGTWEILDPMLAAGELPVLADLCAKGLTADLDVILPSSSPVLWTTLASGKGVEKHGIYDHLRTAMPFGLPSVPHQIKRCKALTKPVRMAVLTYNRFSPLPTRFSRTCDVHVRRLWDILDEHDYGTIVLNWLITCPARSRCGILASDQLAHWKGREGAPPGLAAPDSLIPSLMEHVVLPSDVPDSSLYSFLDTTGLDANGLEALKKVRPTWFRVTRRELAFDLTTSALAQYAFPLVPDWRLAGAYYRAMDNSHHLTWNLRNLPGVDLVKHPERRFRNVVQRYYTHCDNLLAEILTQADESTVVLVVSDHGWESMEYGHSRAPSGFLVMAGGPTRSTGRRLRLHIADLAPTILALLGMPVAQDMDGNVARGLVYQDFWERHPVRLITTYEVAGESPEDSPVLDMDSETMSHLRALGYLD
jgi:hypothetical protein